MTLVLYKR